MEEEGQKAEDENEVKKLLFRFSGMSLYCISGKRCARFH